MLKFFRDIRQNLLLKNMTRKYLKYAIGEILLVVIGILIALSLNNWNEERKEGLKESVFLEKMLEDLEAQEAEIDNVARANARSIHRAIAMFEMMGEDLMMGEDFRINIKKNAPQLPMKFIEYAISQPLDKPITTENFGAMLGRLSNQRVIDLYQTTHLELLATGQYYLIKDAELHEAIIYNYSRNQDFMDVQEPQKENKSNLVNFLQQNGIPIINSLSYEEVMSKISDQETFKATLQNYIFLVTRSVSIFYYTAKGRGDELSEKIKAYLDDPS